MSPLELLRTRLGLTRGDLTVALFLATTALVGFFYTTFVEADGSTRRRAEMHRLVAVADSISLVHSQKGLGDILLNGPPEPWRPLDAEEVIDEGTDGEGRVELTLDDVAPIDPNTAPAEILELLPGVGEKTAAKIVAARPFMSVEDLVRVHGIGEKKLAKMRPYLVVRRTEGSMPDSTATDSGKLGALISVDISNPY